MSPPGAPSPARVTTFEHQIRLAAERPQDDIQVAIAIEVAEPRHRWPGRGGHQRRRARVAACSVSDEDLQSVDRAHREDVEVAVAVEVGSLDVRRGSPRVEPRTSARVLPG